MRQAEVEKVYKESVEKLEHIAGMTAEEAKQQLYQASIVVEHRSTPLAYSRLQTKKR